MKWVREHLACGESGLRAPTAPLVARARPPAADRLSPGTDHLQSLLARFRPFWSHLGTFGIGFTCVTAIFWGGNFTFSCQSQSVSYLRIQIQIGKAVFSTIIAQALGLVYSRLPETQGFPKKCIPRYISTIERIYYYAGSLIICRLVRLLVCNIYLYCKHCQMLEPLSVFQ